MAWSGAADDDDDDDDDDGDAGIRSGGRFSLGFFDGEGRLASSFSSSSSSSGEGGSGGRTRFLVSQPENDTLRWDRPTSPPAAAAVPLLRTLASWGGGDGAGGQGGGGGGGGGRGADFRLGLGWGFGLGLDFGLGCGADAAAEEGGERGADVDVDLADGDLADVDLADVDLADVDLADADGGGGEDRLAGGLPLAGAGRRSGRPGPSSSPPSPAAGTGTGTGTAAAAAAAAAAAGGEGCGERDSSSRFLPRITRICREMRLLAAPLGFLRGAGGGGGGGWSVGRSRAPEGGRK